MRCSACGADVNLEARFCPQCAYPIAAGSATPPADALRAALEAAIGFQYRITRLLGRGGMGAVYLAHELALDRDVAIKVLPPERGEAEEGRERFRREARTAARLSHPSIVPLHTFGDVRGIVYYVMGYVRGEPLSVKLRREGRLPAEETRRLLSEIAGALEYAHGQGVVHRDLKPDNVLIEEGSQSAMLTDFGIAKTLGSGTLTATGAVVGTPHYMSPEQAAGKADVDGRTDLYSLGVMGYAMLAGRLPFEGKTAGEILVQHMTKEPPPLAPLVSGAPEALVKAVMRCLSKDPASRWPDAKALRQALTPEEESELPESLRVVKAVAQGSFLGLLLVTPYWMQFWIERWVSGETGFWAFFGDLARALPFAVAVFLPLTAFAARREGHSWSAIFHNALLQPTWWRSWYPRRFRRPSDVWERLPGPVRRLRLLAAALLLWSGFVLSPVVIYMEAATREYARWGAPRVHPLKDDFWKLTSGGSFLVTVGLFTLMAIQIAGAWNRLRKQAAGTLALDEVWQVLLASTADRRLWSRPAVAGVLELPSLHVGMPEPATGEKVEQALMRLADQVPAAHKQVVQRARDVARFARQSLASLDEELRALEQDFDAAEAARLDGKARRPR